MPRFPSNPTTGDAGGRAGDVWRCPKPHKRPLEPAAFMHAAAAVSQQVTPYLCPYTRCPNAACIHRRAGVAPSDGGRAIQVPRSYNTVCPMGHHAGFARLPGHAAAPGAAPSHPTAGTSFRGHKTSVTPAGAATAPQPARSPGGFTARWGPASSPVWSLRGTGCAGPGWRGTAGSTAPSAGPAAPAAAGWRRPKGRGWG